MRERVIINPDSLCKVLRPAALTRSKVEDSSWKFLKSGLNFVSEKMEVSSENVKYSEDFIDTVYDYQTTIVEKSNGKLLVSENYRKPIDFGRDCRVNYLKNCKPFTSN